MLSSHAAFCDVIPSTLGYGCSVAVIFWAKHDPNSEIKSIEDRKVDNRLEKKSTFYRPCERYKVSCRLAPFPPISKRTEVRHINMAWLPSAVKNGGLSSGFFQDEFLQDSRHFNGRNVSMKQHFEVFLSKSSPALTNMYELAKCHHAGVVPRHDVRLLSNDYADKLQAQSIPHGRDSKQ